MKVLYSLLVLALSAPLLHGQDLIFSQYYSSPTQTNPAMAGMGLCGGRVVMNYRNQWPSLSGHFRSTALSYDQKAESLGGAFGINLLNDVAGDGLLTTRAISAIYSYHITLNRHWKLNAAIQGTYVQRSIDFSRLYFADQIEAKKGFTKPTQETLPYEKVNLPSVSTGFLLHGKGFYAGVSVFHLNEPNQSFFGNSDAGTFLPRRMNLHAGMSIPVGQYRGPDRSKQLLLSPGILFSLQEKYTQLNLGFYAQKNGLVTGVWFRQTQSNPDALIVLLGFHREAFKIGYSYDITVSRARAAVKGSHEVSIGYLFCIKKGMTPNWLTDDCPTF